MNELDARFIKSSVTAMHDMTKSKDVIRDVYETINRKINFLDGADAMESLVELLYSSLQKLTNIEFSPVISKEDAHSMSIQLINALQTLSRVCKSSEKTLSESEETTFSELIEHLSADSNITSVKSEPAGICIEDDDDDEDEDD